MTPETVQQRTSNPESLLLIDVRNGWEYRAGHIQGAVHLPYWKIMRLRSLLAQRGPVEILLYCEHGPRAWLAGLLLKLIGIDVAYLDGHLLRWKRENRPLSREPG